MLSYYFAKEDRPYAGSSRHISVSIKFGINGKFWLNCESENLEAFDQPVVPLMCIKVAYKVI